MNNFKNSFRNTVSGLKEHWKNPILRGSLIIAIIIFMAGVIITNHSQTQGEQKIDDAKIEILETVKNCSQSIGQPVSRSECAEKFGLTENQIKILAENVLEISEIEVEKGWAAIVIKDFPSAKEHLNRAYELNPNDVGIWRDLAFTYLNLKEYNKVVEFSDKVLSEDPTDINCLDARGVAFYKLGRNEKALYDGLIAQEIQPYICREFNLALYYAGVGNVEEAKKIMDGIIKKDKRVILTCWSPSMSKEPPRNIEDYDICLFDPIKGEAICRSIVKEGWWSETI